MPAPAQKLYCYVEETGQDTQGRICIVTVVISDHHYQQLIAVCEAYEQASHKGRTKWHGTNSKTRLEYMRLVIGDIRFRGVLCYSKFPHRVQPNFDTLTVDTLAGVVSSKLESSHYVVEAWIDGLSETKRTEYANHLRDKGLRNVHLHRVRKEDSNTLIRLADALAGLLRDAIEGKYLEAVHLVQAGHSHGVVIEV